MASTATAREKLPTPATSLTEMILNRIESTPSREAFREPTKNGGWKSLTWKETGDDITKIAAGLIDLGLGLEERVGIASNTRLEWILADLGVALAGGAVTTVYASTGAEDVAFILSDSDTQILFAEGDQLPKIEEQRSNLPHLKKVVLFDGKGDGDFVITLDDLRKQGAAALKADKDLVKNRAAQVKSEHLATLIYTSGTTGKPKGVELTQGNWGYVGAALDALDLMKIDDVQFLWLPLAHVFGSVLIASQIQVGFVTAVDGRVPEIVANLPVVQPTFMGAVPRIFEKVYAGVQAAAKGEGGTKAKMFDWAVGVGSEYAKAKIANGGKAPGGLLAAKHALADKLVLSKVRARMGGKVRFFISGSAPLAGEVAEFFAAVGMPILEGYGLTETSAVVSLVRMDNQKFGTVGEVAPGTEVKIASDGEILVKGPGVMRGYRNRPDANAEVFVEGGEYFATGDIGEIDSKGRLRITDRKKDLFKTSGGKYVAPSPIESQFKAICGIAGNMVVHANNRKFVSAIITLDPDAAAAWAKANGKPTDLASLSKDPQLIATIQAAVDELNSRLNKWEQIKKFEILDHDFSIDEGELTPSLKVKRKVVEEKHKELLDSFYS